MEKKRCLIASAIIASMTIFAACGGDEETTDPAQTEDPVSGSCPIYCEAVVAAGCANGPSTAALCTQNCQANLAGSCQAEMAAVIACVGPSPTVTCVDGYPRASGCDAQAEALNTCKGASGEQQQQQQQQQTAQ
jgi:hypothetical protein